MKADWEETNTATLIGEGVLVIGDGYRAKNSEFVRDGGLPFVRVGDVGGRINTTRRDELPKEARDRYEPKVSRTGDSLITMKGTVGRVARVTERTPEFVYSPQISFWRVMDTSRLHADFVSYWLRSPAFAEQAFATKSATDMADYINLGDQRRMSIALPPLATQRRIAAVLSAFDELIEINERRIELLEELARSLYREWFVRFRFPGHEGVGFVDSEAGAVPDRWIVGPTAELIGPIGGGTPSKKKPEYWDGGQIAWYTPSDLTRGRHRYVNESAARITAEGLANSSARLFPPGSVLMTSRATLGVLAIAAEPGTCNQGFIVIPPVDGIPPSYVYHWLADHSSELEAVATGATFKEITRRAFKRFPFTLPSREVLDQFGKLVHPLEGEIASAEQHNRALAATRDLLLPRLVTGRLDIDDLDLGDLLPAEAA